MNATALEDIYMEERWTSTSGLLGISRRRWQHLPIVHGLTSQNTTRRSHNQSV